MQNSIGCIHSVVVSLQFSHFNVVKWNRLCSRCITTVLLAFSSSENYVLSFRTICTWPRPRPWPRRFGLVLHHC